MKFLTRKGFLIEEQGMTYRADTDPDLALRAPASGGLHLSGAVTAGSASAAASDTMPRMPHQPTMITFCQAGLGSVSRICRLSRLGK